MTQERFEALMVRVADGLATPDEERELAARLARDPADQAELERHRALVQASRHWIQRLKLDAAQDQQDRSPRTRAEERLGLALLLTGLALLSGFGLVEIVLDDQAPAWLRAGVGLSGAGTLLLLASVARRRLATLKSDRYEEVIR